MSSPLELPPEEMRRLGYEAIDALVDRWAGLGSDVPWRGATRDELEPRLSAPPSEEGRPAGEVMAQALREVLPIAGRIDHPRFFAFVPSSPTWPSILGDLLASGFNVFQGTWLESAGPSELELVVLEWFRVWLGLPPQASGLLTSGGSAANLCALVTAREAAGWPERGALYLGDQAHSSLERAARIAGIPPQRIRKVGGDASYRMDPSRLADAIASDRRAGLVPMAVCASAGATNTGAVDPLAEIGALCRQQALWFHIDAAYGGFSVLTPRGRELLRGIESADSITLDPHKWLFQPYETGCLMVRDGDLMEAAFHVLPEYLQDTRLGRRQVNFADRGLQLTRAFRALRVWMSIETFGTNAHAHAIETAIQLAARAGDRVESSARLELLSPPSLGIVCFRFRPGPGWEGDLGPLNARIQERINREGAAMMSSTRLAGEYALRLCILNYRSSWEDVESTLERIEEIGEELIS